MLRTLLIPQTVARSAEEAVLICGGLIEVVILSPYMYRLRLCSVIFKLKSDDFFPLNEKK